MLINTQDSISDFDSSYERHLEFTRQFERVEPALHRRVLMLVGNRSDADDVIQEVSLVLWQKFDEYIPGTNFSKWSMVVATNVVRNFSRKRRRHASTTLSEQTMSKLVQTQKACEELLELRRERLTKCLSQLNDSERHFLSRSYDPNRTMVQLADEMGRPVHSLYVKLSRLRKVLYHCINRNLSETE